MNEQSSLIKSISSDTKTANKVGKQVKICKYEEWLSVVKEH
jgi:hypothetical protein